MKHKECNLQFNSQCHMNDICQCCFEFKQKDDSLVLLDQF